MVRFGGDPRPGIGPIGSSEARNFYQSMQLNTGAAVGAVVPCP